MSIPIQLCGPAGGGWEERMEPESADPQPISRMREGEVRESKETARWVMVAWMCFIREEVVYLRASVSL